MASHLFSTKPSSDPMLAYCELDHWTNFSAIQSKYTTFVSRKCLWKYHLQNGYFVSAFCLSPWSRHQMETFSALLAICAGNSPVTGEFPTQRPVTWSFGVFFDLCLNKQLIKQWWGWWFETPSHPLWRHCNAQQSWYWPSFPHNILVFAPES